MGNSTFTSQKTRFRHACSVWHVVALVGVFLMSQAQGATNYVTTGGGGDGSSWLQPTTLANALATASANDVIWMKQGTYTDAHLKSKAGRWNGSRWTKDKVNSPCIDAGDPASDYSREPDGKAINLGAYGNTPEASRISMLGTVLLIR